MPIEVSNVTIGTDTFAQWIEKTNVVLSALRTQIVTTNSNTASGNAAITGTFAANTISISFVTSQNSSPVAINTSLVLANTSHFISVSSQPVSNNHVTNKQYVDTVLGNFSTENAIVYSIALG